ncbi:YHS domain-containing protein [Thermicanus aegyptius]|uniref:YHS domain-containing protein n=1 Tax=Thermicanus aegyptius TaxID=94009 RepID=UPI0004902F49|nr:YHS domain-containing protein [Thermicanus aegyptius]
MSQKAKDPVCGMDVEVEGNELQITYGGNTYYFCSKICMEKFEKEPGSYVKSGHDCCDKQDGHHAHGEHGSHHHHHKGHSC